MLLKTSLKKTNIEEKTSKKEKQIMRRRNSSQLVAFLSSNKMHLVDQVNLKKDKRICSDNDTDIELMVTLQINWEL